MRLPPEVHVLDDVEVVAEGEVLVDDLDPELRRVLRPVDVHPLAVVLISHNLHDIFAVADRITVLRLGRSIAVYERAAVTQNEVVHAITAGVPTKVSGIPDDVPEPV